MTFEIQPYHPSDLVALYRICLFTGKDGQDASQIYKDPDLLGHIYVAPYAVSEPDLCFLLAHNGERCGYILGTKDTEAFYQPHLRQRYTLPDTGDHTADAHMIRNIHQKRILREITSSYPAHLHIDLLPVAQGQGWGHRMMDTFLNRLRELNVEGVHLGVSKNNPRAVRFYKREGFQVLKEYPTGFTLSMVLS
jgi:ribosomal protein S18 acetylase RimI-like enzyme